MYYYFDFSRLTDKLAEFIADPFSYGRLSDFIGHGGALLFYGFLFTVITALIVGDIILWTVSNKSKKAALKNLNGDKKLYNKIVKKSGYFIVFCIMSTVPIVNMISNCFVWSLIYPWSFSVTALPSDSVKFLFVFDILNCTLAACTWFIISIVMRGKADKSALNKSTHSKVVRKIKENKYKR